VAPAPGGATAALLTGLFVVFVPFRVGEDPGPLDLALKPPQCTVQRLVFSDSDFGQPAHLQRTTPRAMPSLYTTRSMTSNRRPATLPRGERVEVPVGAEEAIRTGGISSAMWQVPTALSLVAGRGEGGTEINAFDRALRDAGVCDLNFLRVTSIVPAGVRIIELPAFPAGILMPAVYARITSVRPGDRICAALGVGLSREHPGVIMEHVGHTSRAEAERTVRHMVEEGFHMRRLTPDEILVAAAEHTVEKVGCAVAVALFWPTPTGLAR
jgi:arginine decarboxylase